ncbi:MAG: tetratricopeptide repeat protein [Planctomycetia bacterium]|nr:tetratricopeptide repeat protein [Planctomycetia bacterium]
MATLRCSTSRLLLCGTLLTGACGFLRPSRADDDATPPRTLMRLPTWIESFGDDATPSTSEAAADRSTATTVADWSDSKPVATPVIRPVAAPPLTPVAAPATTESSGFRRWINDRVATLPKPTTLAPSAAEAKPPAEVTAPPLADVDPHAKPTGPTPDEMPTLSVDPASFRGALPGKTTRAEIEKSWGAGEALNHEDGATGAVWVIEPFERVEVSFQNDLVIGIRIKLGEAVAVADLARQLEIADLRTVAVRDDQGAEIGVVYPERGVILSVSPGTKDATGILIEPLDPDSFVLRAEGEIETCSAYAVADLQYAIQIDPQHVRAHRLLLAMAADQGKWTQALTLAKQAVRLDPDDVWTKLKCAGVLLALDRPEEARVMLDGVASAASSSPLVMAQASRLAGRIELARKTPDHQKAVEQFGEAIRRGSPLLAKRSPAVQAAVRELLLDAHLGTALAIARGTWQQKSRVIPKWISRADAVVKEFDGNDRERNVLELQLCRGALAAAAGSTEAIEPLAWVKRLLELRDRIGETEADPWRRRQLDWEVGQGLADGLTAAQKRGDATDMLDNATLTAAYLERGAEQRELTAAERKNVGELMFRIGIMHSLQRGDHATAVTWFDRAIPLWDGNDRFELDGDLGRLGESYVSMAISYWQVARREEAVTLSRRGVDLMVAAVDKSQLEERALAVAYGNLATMYAEQGDDQQSRNYAEMASRAEATGTVR